MQSKYFLCKDDTNAVYSLFEQALNRVKPKAAPRPQDDQNQAPPPKHPLEAGLPIEKKGLAIKVLEIIEKLFGHDLGSHYRELPLVNFNFDPEARQSFENYRCIVNAMLDSVNMKREMVETVIHDGHVLFCELLERLLQAALCDRTLENDGQALAGAVKFFCESYILFLQQAKYSITLKQSTNFRNILNSELINQLDSLKDEIELVRNIHKPREAFQKLHTYFKGVNDTIRMQLTAFLYNKSYTVRSAIVDLHPRYLLNGELDKIEDTVFGNDRLLSSSSKTTRMCGYFHIQDATQISFLSLRYSILEKNEHLLTILDGIQMIVGITGWLVFLTDKINLSVLKKIMREIDNNALEATIHENDPISTPYFHALSALNSISVGNRQLLSEGEEGLAILASRKVKLNMLNRLGNAVKMIKAAEHALGIRGESIININLLPELEQQASAASPRAFQGQSPQHPQRSSLQSPHSFMPPPPSYSPVPLFDQDPPPSEPHERSTDRNNPPGSGVKRTERTKAKNYKLPGEKPDYKKRRDDEDDYPDDSYRGIPTFQ